MAEAPGMESLYQTYKDDGFIVITLMAENNSNVTPSVEEMKGWADDLGLTHPIVADEGWGVTFSYVTGGSVGLPASHLIAPGGEVIEVNGYGISPETIEAILPASDTEAE